MKKLNYGVLLVFVASIFGSCAVGTYVPHSVNLTGTQTTVVLDKANFRVVRNVEAVVEVDNDRLRRADVEKSAFAELTRKYPLTGSQAYINVVFDEVRREKVFAFHSGRFKLKQYVAVRATIIEFLQDNGQPIPSASSPYNTAPQRKASVETPQVESTEMSPEQIHEADTYYLAWLYKTGQLNGEYINKLSKTYDFEQIRKMVKRYSAEELHVKSKGHDNKLEKYVRK